MARPDFGGVAISLDFFMTIRRYMSLAKVKEMYKDIPDSMHFVDFFELDSGLA